MSKVFLIFFILFPVLTHSQIKVYEEQTITGQFSNLDYYFPKFCAADIDHDDKIDILYYSSHQILHYVQSEIGSLEFSLVSDNFLPIPISYDFVELIDLNNDGNFELLTGNQFNVDIYIQSDINTYNYQLQNTTGLLTQNGEGWDRPFFAYGNLNETNNLELIVGFYNNSPSPPQTPNYSKLFLFEYDGFNINLLDDDFTDLIFLAYCSPSLTDYDHNNKLDLVVGACYNLNLFEQEDTNSLNFNHLSNTFDDINNDVTSFPYFCDINNDGIDDLLIGKSDPSDIRIFIRKLWADFNFEQLSTETYQFYCNSIGEIETYQWDFNNDGLIDSDEENPQWTFNESGSHQVSLEILNGIYHDIIQKVIIIETGSDPNLLPVSHNDLNAFPNPFNPSTTIEFSIENDSKIDLSIFNIRGQKIRTLAKDEFTKGSHSIIWNGDDEFGNCLSSGVYFYKLTVNDKTETVNKCLLLK